MEKENRHGVDTIGSNIFISVIVIAIYLTLIILFYRVN